MAKQNLKKLKEDFESLLGNVWEVWEQAKAEADEETEEEENDPFQTREWTWQSNLNEQERESLREDLGWLLGVAAATGWKLYKPGPREWNPR